VKGVAVMGDGWMDGSRLSRQGGRSHEQPRTGVVIIPCALCGWAARNKRKARVCVD
jgi:hypothetical protein